MREPDGAGGLPSYGGEEGARGHGGASESTGNGQRASEAESRETRPWRRWRMAVPQCLHCTDQPFSIPVLQSSIPCKLCRAGGGSRWPGIENPCIDGGLRASRRAAN